MEIECLGRIVDGRKSKDISPLDKGSAVKCNSIMIDSIMIDVYLVKFKSQDFNEYFQLVGDARVMEMITERAIPIEEAQVDFEQLIDNNKLNENFGNFKILTLSSNEFVGLAKLALHEEDQVEAELGYMILPYYWGKGIASQVARQLIEHAKQQQSLEKLVAIIDPKNIPSRKILINNGFVSKEFKDFDGLPGEILDLDLSYIDI